MSNSPNETDCFSPTLYLARVLPSNIALQFAHVTKLMRRGALMDGQFELLSELWAGSHMKDDLSTWEHMIHMSLSAVSSVCEPVCFAHSKASTQGFHAAYELWPYNLAIIHVYQKEMGMVF